MGYTHKWKGIFKLARALLAIMIYSKVEISTSRHLCLSEHARCQREDLSVFKMIARMLLTKMLDPILTEAFKGNIGDSTLDDLWCLQNAWQFSQLSFHVYSNMDSSGFWSVHFPIYVRCITLERGFLALRGEDYWIWKTWLLISDTFRERSFFFTF